MSAPEQALGNLIGPALDAYSAEFDRHRHDWRQGGCVCGWKPRPDALSARRSTGMHVAAARRRASDAYRAETSRLIEAQR